MSKKEELKVYKEEIDTKLIEWAGLDITTTIVDWAFFISLAGCLITIFPSVVSKLATRLPDFLLFIFGWGGTIGIFFFGIWHHKLQKQGKKLEVKIKKLQWEYKKLKARSN